jgi:hypothetical protein
VQYLMDYAKRDDVTALVNQATGFDIVHGVTVQLHPTWLGLWRLHHSLVDKQWDIVDDHMAHAIERHGPFGSFPSMSQLLPMFSQFQVTDWSPVPIDPTWRCRTWESHAEITRRCR